MPYKMTENAVISRIRDYLRKEGFKGIKTKNTRQRGIDVEASYPGNRKQLYLEAKGEKSSKPESSQYKRGFNTGQKKDHLGKQLLWVCQMLVRDFGRPTHIGIALPNDQKNSELIEQIEPVLKKLGVTCFLANRNGTITIKGAPL